MHYEYATMSRKYFTPLSLCSEGKMEIQHNKNLATKREKISGSLAGEAGDGYGPPSEEF